jgi:predicted ATP-dependent protease
VDGEIVGQVNGLAIYALGDYMFGKPSRITASTSMGRAGIINIEREADMSGSTHNKGVLILGGYLRKKFAQDKPLTVSASIAFEQSYGNVDGDSASSTEVYALLSSLSGAPIKQGIAVTGSVNQKGEVQAIGGVNQKIEGFYDCCLKKGANKSQGVIIPESNVKDLMLRKDVVEGVKRASSTYIL